MDSSADLRGVVHTDESRAAMTGRTSAKRELVNRMSRIEGQVRGLSRMVEDDKYCIDILTQVAAASSALQCVALRLLEDHMQHCLVDAARAGGAEREDKLREATEAIGRLVRS